MSGGSRDYVFCAIQNELCGRMYDAEINDLMNDIAEIAHDVEWYDSADIGKESYMKSVRNFKNKWFNSPRDERLKKYIDAELKETKERLYTLLGLEAESDETD